MNTADTVRSMEIELDHLRSKDIASEQMISLMKEQLGNQATEMVEMASKHADDIRLLRQRCDVAIRNEVEVIGILTTAAKSIVDGLRKMKGDNTPAIMPTAQARPADHPALPAPELEDGDTANLRDILHRLPAVDFRSDARKASGRQG